MSLSLLSDRCQIPATKTCVPGIHVWFMRLMTLCWLLQLRALEILASCIYSVTNNSLKATHDNASHEAVVNPLTMSQETFNRYIQVLTNCQVSTRGVALTITA